MSTVEERAYYAQKQKEYRQRNADNPEYRMRKRTANKIWYRKNRAKISLKKRIKYAENPEPIKEKARSYRQMNPEKVKAYRNANRDKRSAQARAWKASNSERYLKKSAEWRATHRDEIRKYTKSHYKLNAETLREKSRKWRKENPEKLKEQGRRYRKENPDKIYAKNAARRAKLKGATVERIDRGEIYLRDKGICGICKTYIPLHEVTLDHIIPLAKGGEHSKQNIQLAHRSCNSAKGSKMGGKDHEFE